MKISESAKREMKNKILEDLYGKPEVDLFSRQEDIARRNRIYELEPYQDILDTLPENLIAHARQYTVQINYKPSEDGSTHAISEQWKYYYEDAVPTFVLPGSNTYGSFTSVIGKLDPRLYTEAAALAEDLIFLRTEKDELTKYLKETLEEWSGPKQLRTVWPESLHKYLPAIKPRAKKDKSSVPTAPTALGTRLTTNLLEGE